MGKSFPLACLTRRFTRGVRMCVHDARFAREKERETSARRVTLIRETDVSKMLIAPRNAKRTKTKPVLPGIGFRDANRDDAPIDVIHQRLMQVGTRYQAAPGTQPAIEKKKKKKKTARSHETGISVAEVGTAATQELWRPAAGDKNVWKPLLMQRENLNAFSATRSVLKTASPSELKFMGKETRFSLWQICDLRSRTCPRRLLEIIEVSYVRRLTANKNCWKIKKNHRKHAHSVRFLFSPPPITREEPKLAERHSFEQR